MKCIDIDQFDEMAGTRLDDNEIFGFHCHPGLKCFNQCCRNLNLFLYPYDVVRLKNKLGITTDQFLDRHVDIVLRESNFLPDVLLKMSDTPEKTCPFLTEAGCGVYPDRPDTCRTFPMERGLSFEAETKKIKMIYFFRPPDFCLGRLENKTWTAQAWLKDQDAVYYNKMTALWAELKRLFQTDPWGREGPYGQRGKMAFMATYNIDRFRDFVFNSSFLKRYKVKADVLKKVKADDMAMMKFGFKWVKLFLWGIKAKEIRHR